MLILRRLLAIPVHAFVGIHRFSLTLFNYVLVSVATTFDTESIPACSDILFINL